MYRTLKLLHKLWFRNTRARPPQRRLLASLNRLDFWHEGCIRFPVSVRCEGTERQTTWAVQRSGLMSLNEPQQLSSSVSLPFSTVTVLYFHSASSRSVFLCLVHHLFSRPPLIAWRCISSLFACRIYLCFASSPSFSSSAPSRSAGSNSIFSFRVLHWQLFHFRCFLSHTSCVLVLECYFLSLCGR